MEYIKDITIMEAAIHVLDDSSTEPILNEFKLELNDETYIFIYKHIEKCLKNDDLKYARFNDGNGVIKKVSQEYLNLESNLLDTSKELAKQLFVQMRTNGNIPSCDLITVGFTTEYGPMLGILKMDYVKNFTHEVSFIDDKLGINLVTQTAGLPSGKINKAAFIKDLKRKNEFDLMVIDKRSKRKADEEYGSNFFTDIFLNCVLVENERDMTKNLLRTTEAWTRNHVREDADKAEKIRSTVKSKLLEEDTIDIDKLGQEIFENNDVGRLAFIENIKANGVPDEVAVDKEWVEKKLKRVRLKVDKDIDIYLSQEAYKDNSKFEIKRNGDGSINITVKNVMNYIEK